jgi:hypothetical protein
MVTVSYFILEVSLFDVYLKLGVGTNFHRVSVQWLDNGDSTLIPVILCWILIPMFNWFWHNWLGTSNSDYC